MYMNEGYDSESAVEHICTYVAIYLTKLNSKLSNEPILLKIKLYWTVMKLNSKL